MPQPPLDYMLITIQEMNHHIRTSFGLSEESLQKCFTSSHFQGILQGNGAAPKTWVLISTPLLNMLRKNGHGAKFCTPITGNITQIVGYAFVDDTDLITFEMFDETITWADIEAKMQDSIDLWEGGLKTTSGAIVPEKSWIYPLDFVFDPK